MSTVKQVIKRMEIRRRRLAKETFPRRFLNQYLPKWRELGSRVAMEVLVANRPAGMDADVWGEKVERAMKTYGALMFAGESPFVMLFMGASAGEGRTVRDDISLTLEDIEAYVEAGRDGDPLGKPDIDERDKNKTSRQIAMNIALSIAEGNTERERQVEAFLAEYGGGAEAKQVYQAILDAWREVVGDQVVADFRRIVSEMMKV